ncbi:MAG: hypothetical protein ACXADO_10045 [Candidatus Thorarchaeota archaeon]|jgi:hypothetical protein
MRLPVCRWDLESDILCPQCQERLDNGELSKFEVSLSNWFLEREKLYPSLDKLNLLRAQRIRDRLILIVKKKTKEALTSATGLMEEMQTSFGEVMIIEGPIKLRTLIRTLISPCVELGVNSLYLPDGIKESIVMLRPEDKEKIVYSKDELREIATAVLDEIVLFQYQDEQDEGEIEEDDEFGQKLKSYGRRRR